MNIPNCFLPDRKPRARVETLQGHGTGVAQPAVVMNPCNLGEAKRVRQQVRYWWLHFCVMLLLDDPVRGFNPMVHGWLDDYDNLAAILCFKLLDRGYSPLLN